ncbi:hypothetical protein Amsp01_090080 [Amycolatopsis sp. NBRC 101858]|nr:hypothetical protein Amsp01_090080 [Amycolatopsis sp. NBRC 101858]
MSVTLHTCMPRRAAASVLVAGALTGSLLAAAAPAQGAVMPPVSSVVAADPDQPDVGLPGEVSRQAGVPAVAPDGSLVWPTDTDVALRSSYPASSSTAQAWIGVVATADGARIRARPVNGPVLGTIARGATFWVSCKRGASDGHPWGWSYRGGTYGWVRGDLWEVEQHTGPGGAGTPHVPWCP